MIRAISALQWCLVKWPVFRSECHPERVVELGCVADSRNSLPGGGWSGDLSSPIALAASRVACGTFRCWTRKQTLGWVSSRCRRCSPSASRCEPRNQARRPPTGMGDRWDAMVSMSIGLLFYYSCGLAGTNPDCCLYFRTCCKPYMHAFGQFASFIGLATCRLSRISFDSYSQSYFPGNVNRNWTTVTETETETDTATIATKEIGFVDFTLAAIQLACSSLIHFPMSPLAFCSRCKPCIIFSMEIRINLFVLKPLSVNNILWFSLRPEITKVKASNLTYPTNMNFLFILVVKSINCCTIAGSWWMLAVGCSAARFAVHCSRAQMYIRVGCSQGSAAKHRQRIESAREKER